MDAAKNRFSRTRIFCPGLAVTFLLLVFSLFQTFAEGANPSTTNSDSTADSKASPKPSKIHIIFFTPADVSVPKDAEERLTQIADATDKHFFDWMNHWGYPPAVKSLFERRADGSVEFLKFHGNKPLSSHKYDRPNYARSLIQGVSRRAHLPETGDVWWLFIYLGDRPKRFEDFRGTGNSRDGGWAMVNYDSLPGEIRPDLGLAEGFNGDVFLKGTIHELGHAFGLMHLGPDLSLGLGNSLMGPTTAVYKKRNGPKPEQVYLSDASAAMLWKHPLFSGVPLDRDAKLTVKLTDYRPVFNATNDEITISGKLVSSQPAHSVLLIDDEGRPNDEYWHQGHSARLAPDGTFQLKIPKPPKVAGHYRILFCFNNGLVTGDGEHVAFEDRGDIEKSYTFSNGAFQFGD